MLASKGLNESVEKLMTEKVAGAEKTFSEKLNTVAEKVAGAEKTFGEKVAGAEKTFGEKVAAAEKTFGEKVVGVEKEMNAKIQAAQEAAQTATKSVNNLFTKLILLLLGSYVLGSFSPLASKLATAKVDEVVRDASPTASKQMK